MSCCLISLHFFSLFSNFVLHFLLNLFSLTLSPFILSSCSLSSFFTFTPSFTVFCSLFLSLIQYSFSHLCFASSLHSSCACFAPYLIFSSCFFFTLSNLAIFFYSFVFFLHLNFSFPPFLMLHTIHYTLTCLRECFRSNHNTLLPLPWTTAGIGSQSDAHMALWHHLRGQNIQSGRERLSPLKTWWERLEPYDKQKSYHTDKTSELDWAFRSHINV